uniref:Coactosin-like protein n=1 Tax=Oryzias sinensis TaxID=183150 RepID=A0A8C7ZJB8_9TELE
MKVRCLLLLIHSHVLLYLIEMLKHNLSTKSMYQIMRFGGGNICKIISDCSFRYLQVREHLYGCCSTSRWQDGATTDHLAEGSLISGAAFKYEGSTIVPAGQGTDYEDFKKLCTDDSRLFGFVRFTTGDAMSKRVKFTLITWIGENISGLQRAKISTDKTMIKDIVQTFAKEFMVSDLRELDEEYIRTELKKAGGANYDAQAE